VSGPLKQTRHKGWNAVSVIDSRQDDESDDSPTYETCEMCGNGKIRFVHVMSHESYPDELRVGCRCAEKMSDDYEVTAFLPARVRVKSCNLYCKTIELA
jgi:hypothetical protein